MAERWLTYQQAGEALGMSGEAVRQRARRLGWRTQPGNEGRALVLLPEGVAVRPRVRPAVQTPEQPPVQPAIQTGEGNDLAEALKGQLERERERADKAEGQVAAERERAERAEAEREAARIAAARAEGEAVALREQVQAERERVQAAEAAKDAARAELADWTAGGPLGRAWRALVYRRAR